MVDDKWQLFVWISNGRASGYQIPFDIGTNCKPTSFDPFKIWMRGFQIPTDLVLLLLIDNVAADVVVVVVVDTAVAVVVVAVATVVVVFVYVVVIYDEGSDSSSIF